MVGGVILTSRLAVSLVLLLSSSGVVLGDDCRITPVLHVLQTPGCSPMTIPSFACVGKCTSYVQVSGSKMWQMERSCMCCQESGEREATVTLSCPKAPPGSPKVQKIVTKAPVDCMCRPCTAVDEGSIMPQEMAGYMDAMDVGPLSIVPMRMQMSL
ncbi:bursicon [Folsomia candida]|uniref:bursicon n=1 Tax=Folsomia candida TaxID=158441 RepID=UPI000B8F1936|nr:bursicon [Folsomia candida]